MKNTAIKILLSSLVIIITLFSFCNSSFASIDFSFPYTVTYNDIEYILNCDTLSSKETTYNLKHEDLQNYFIYYDSSICRFTIYLFYEDNFRITYRTYNGNPRIDITHKDGTTLSRYDEPILVAEFNNVSTNTTIKAGSLDNDNHEGINVHSSFTFIESSLDVYDYNNPETVVFQRSPVQNSQGVVLETAEQIPQVMIQTVQKIIPVCLIVLSIVLVICLIKSVIYRHL